MSIRADDLADLARRAATGAGFSADDALRFGQAAPWHLAGNGGAEALIDALVNAADSPILRLPLLADDALRAARMMGGTVELSLHRGDAPLAPAYVRALPRRAEAIEVDTATPQPRLKVTFAAPDVPGALPDRMIMVEDRWIRRLTMLADRAAPPPAQANGSSGYPTPTR